MRSESGVGGMCRLLDRPMVHHGRVGGGQHIEKGKCQADPVNLTGRGFWGGMVNGGHVFTPDSASTRA